MPIYFEQKMTDEKENSNMSLPEALCDSTLRRMIPNSSLCLRSPSCSIDNNLQISVLEESLVLLTRIVCNSF